MTNLQSPARSRGLALVVAMLLLSVGSVGCGGDDDGGQSSGNGGTTTVTQDGSQESLPDFVIDSVLLQPSGVVSPGQVQISATVRNVGAAGYGAAIVVQAPGNHTGTIAGGLAAGASGVAIIDFPAVSTDTTYTMSLIVDPDDVIAEESESNNESGTITIQTSP